MMFRDNLPARTALITAGLLGLLTLAAAVAAYTVTALLVREGVDAALRAALPAPSESLEELLEAIGHDEQERREGHRDEGGRDEHDDDEDGRTNHPIQVITPQGVITTGSQELPVDPEALRLTRQRGEAFQSVVPAQAREGWRPRTGPQWWQALTPASEELRVIYALVSYEDGTSVLQMAAPIGTTGRTLRRLLRWLLALAAVEVVLCGAIAWWMAAGLYRPLRTVTATAADVTAQTPGLRIPHLWPDRTLRRLIGVLNEMIGRLQEAYETQGRFAGAAAHELRSPLAAMRAELEVALRKERTADEYRKALEGALEENVRLSALAEHLLVLARYERGASLNMQRNLPLTPLLQRAADEVRKATGEEVEVTSPPGLLVDGDSLSLERMVSNLVRNGIEAGGAPVSIMARQEREEIILTVTDQGRGIPPHVQSRIFEPFFRADPARGRDGGAGLGLTIVKAIVDAHGGTVTVHSEPGRGTSFDIALPRTGGQIKSNGGV